jgi:hypothetical protein
LHAIKGMPVGPRASSQAGSRPGAGRQLD